MRWSKSTLRNSIFGWMAPAASVPAINPAVRIEAIRHAMLSCLAEFEDDMHVNFGRKLRSAVDIDTLWYSRSELMQLTSRRIGEVRARERMQPITQMFIGLLPESVVHANRQPKGR